MNQINRNQLNPNSRSQHTDTKSTKALKEGVLVNNLIKDDYKEDWFIIPHNPSMPVDLYVKQDKIAKSPIKNPLLLTTVAPLATLGIAAVMAHLTRKTLVAKMDKVAAQLPDIGRNINIDKELTFNVYNYFLNPTPKKLLIGATVAMGAAVEFIAKNTVDGIKDIWIKKQEADIKRDLEESLIEVETRSFSGKNQILRTLLSENAREIKQIKEGVKPTEDVNFKGFDKSIYADFSNGISFAKNNDENKTKSSKNWIYALSGLGTLIGAGLLGHSIFKNIKTVAQTIEKNVKSITPELKQTIYQELPAECGGNVGRNGFNSFVNSPSAFIYSFLVNPTAQTAGLMFGIYTATAATYLGAQTVEAVKDVQVKKTNAQTELQLQDRLVQVELKNFLTKKKSYIQPIMSELQQKAAQCSDPHELDSMGESILYEIKNGPPFVYS